jgi:hypothetical protein
MGSARRLEAIQNHARLRSTHPAIAIASIGVLAPEREAAADHRWDIRGLLRSCRG